MVQIFDTWAGLADVEQFYEWIIAPTKALVDNLRGTFVMGFARSQEKGRTPNPTRRRPNPSRLHKQKPVPACLANPMTKVPRKLSTRAFVGAMIHS